MRRLLIAFALFAASGLHAQTSCPTAAPFGSWYVTNSCSPAATCVAGAPVTLILGEQPAPLYPCRAGEPCPVRYYKLQACDTVTWHFGDGTPNVTATASYMVTHTYAAPGVYSTTATIANALGSIQGGGSVTISANTATYVDFSPSNITVAETAGSITFTLVRSGNLNTTSTVHYQDHSSALSGNVTFAPGETMKSFTRNVVNDHAYGGDISGTVVATATDGTMFHGGTGTARYTVTETDPRPTATVADAIVREGAATADVVVSLSGPFAFSPQFWGIASDYSGPAYCSLPAGATRCVLHFPIVNNDVAEPDKTFTVKVSALPAPNFIRDTATVTIVDDDAAITPAAITAEPSSVKVSAGTDGTVKISVQPPSAAARTVTMWSTRPEVATVPASLTIPAGGSATFDAHALAGGTATIWIVAADGVSLPVEVTVAVPRRRATR